MTQQIFRTPGPYANTILALSEDQRFQAPNLKMQVTSITVLPPAAQTQVPQSQAQAVFAVSGEHNNRFSPLKRFSATDAVYTTDDVPTILRYARPSVRTLLLNELALYNTGALPATPHHTRAQQQHLTQTPPLQNIPITPARKLSR